MKRIILFFSVLIALVMLACGPSSALERLRNQLAKYPEYTIILEDMKEEGNFFKDYYHRYKVILGEEVGDSLSYTRQLTDWERVSKKEYQKYYGYLGMVLASKSPEGEVATEQYPPGYQYVGNPRYGQWRQDASGNSFWEFYGKYALLSHLFGMWGRPVYRADWNDYRDYRSSGRPYFGRNNQYGTSGSYTQKSNPTFFQRRQMKERLRKQSFREKVRQRTRRSRMSSYRSRSGGFGK